MSEKEMLVEKTIALMERAKGRDLYGLWFMLEMGVDADRELFKKKSDSAFRPERIVSKEEYERDLERLTNHVVPYSQVRAEVGKGLMVLTE